MVSAEKWFISMAAVTLTTISESLATRVAPDSQRGLGECECDIDLTFPPRDAHLR